MLQLNNEHPKFSIPMEILCILPKWPDYIHIANILIELRRGYRSIPIRNHRDVRMQFTKLARMDIEIITKLYDGRKICGISDFSWELAQELGQEYWDTVYEPEYTR